MQRTQDRLNRRSAAFCAILGLAFSLNACGTGSHDPKFSQGGGSTAPTISGISPGNGSSSGGTTITLSGTNFSSGSIVTVGGASATNVNVVNAQKMTAVTPAHAAGTVDITVTASTGGTATFPVGFTFNDPVAVNGVDTSSSGPNLNPPTSG